MAAFGQNGLGGMFQQLVDQMLQWLRNLFFKQEMELTLVGLQNSGKTTLVNVVATGGFSEDMIPTVCLCSSLPSLCRSSLSHRTAF